METYFENREAASIAAADCLSAAIVKRLELQGEASLVVSGGTTPGRCFEALATTDLDWASVHVLLSDERWVAADSDASNEKLVRETLLQQSASAAKLLSVVDLEKTPGDQSEILDRTIRTLPFPFAASLLGMGADGHFASLFPDAENLKDGLDSESQTLVMPVTTAASEHGRVSLTLSALSRSDVIVLLIFGDEKKAVYESAKNSASDLPVSRLLMQKRAPVEVFWAP